MAQGKSKSDELDPYSPEAQNATRRARKAQQKLTPRARTTVGGLATDHERQIKEARRQAKLRSTTATSLHLVHPTPTPQVVTTVVATMAPAAASSAPARKPRPARVAVLVTPTVAEQVKAAKVAERERDWNAVDHDAMQKAAFQSAERTLGGYDAALKVAQAIIESSSQLPVVTISQDWKSAATKVAPVQGHAAHAIAAGIEAAQLALNKAFCGQRERLLFSTL